MGREAIEAGSTITRSPRAVHRELAGGAGAVLLDLDTGAYYDLNRVAVEIWSALETPRTLEALLDDLRRRFPDAPPTLDEDVRDFLHELLERGLVTMGR